MKNAIIGTFFCILSFLTGCYVGYETSEEQTVEFDGVTMTRYEIQKMFNEVEEIENAQIIQESQRKHRQKSQRAAQEKRKLRKENRQV